MSIVISGLSICTPNSDSLDSFLRDLYSGKSSVSLWHTYKTTNIHSKIGADLLNYSIEKKMQELSEKLPKEIFQRAKTIIRKVAWSTKISITMSLDAWIDAKLEIGNYNPDKLGIIVASNNINLNYCFKNYEEFKNEPDYIDPLYCISSLDSDHSSAVSEVLGIRGGAYVVAGACASGNLALKVAMDEIRYHGLDTVIILGPIYEFSPVYLHALGMLGAISITNFQNGPQIASRPFDKKREGFVPAHSGGCLVVEKKSNALLRKNDLYSEIVAVASTSDGTRMPHPSIEGQIRTLEKLFAVANLDRNKIDYINAHATSTPQGDLAEINAIKAFFKEHAYNLKINAPKSVLGHATGSAAVVETVAALLQMKNNILHKSINIDELDSQIDLDVCLEEKKVKVDYLLKNSFGFGGINCLAIHKKI